MKTIEYFKHEWLRHGHTEDEWKERSDDIKQHHPEVWMEVHKEMTPTAKALIDKLIAFYEALPEDIRSDVADLNIAVSAARMAKARSKN